MLNKENKKQERPVLKFNKCTFIIILFHLSLKQKRPRHPIFSSVIGVENPSMDAGLGLVIAHIMARDYRTDSLSARVFFSRHVYHF